MQSWLSLLLAVVAAFTYYSTQNVDTDSSVGSAQQGPAPAGAWGPDEMRQLLAAGAGSYGDREGLAGSSPCADGSDPPHERLIVLGDLHGDLGQARAALSLLGATDEVRAIRA